MSKKYTSIHKLFFGIFAMALLLSSCTQKPDVYQVGIIIGADPFIDSAEGFKAEMANLGYIEGENITYETQALNADPAGEKAAAEKFVADGVDLIFTAPTEPSEAAKAAAEGTDIPVVFALAGVEGSTLVNSVSEPGRNVTGVRYPGPEQMSKRLEVMHEIAPLVERVWIAYDPNYPNTDPALGALRPLAASFGITLVEVPVTSLAEIEADLAERAAASDLGMDAMMLMPDTINNTPEGWLAISSFAIEHKLPLGGSFLYTVEGGAVYGNANDLYKVGQLAAPLADKIFKGKQAGTIPVVSPEDDLWINYKVAQELGLTVPDGLLRQALVVIRE